MENVRMKSGCLPGNLLDGSRNGEFEVESKIIEDFS